VSRPALGENASSPGSFAMNAGSVYLAISAAHFELFGPVLLLPPLLLAVLALLAGRLGGC
jgi:hypothetical protein